MTCSERLKSADNFFFKIVKTDCSPRICPTISSAGSILRAVSAFRSSRGLTYTRFIHRALGSAQIQETPNAQAAGVGLVAASQNAASDPVRALDARSHEWTIAAV